VGGDLLLFQHLFWFFGHPEVYIIILPVFGFLAFVIDFCGARLVFSVLTMVFSLCCISLIGFFVWAHHMFVVGMDLDSRVYFGSLTILIGLPTSIKLFNFGLTIMFWDFFWTIEIFLFFVFLVMFLFGGLTGLVLANCGLDVCLHDTYFVVAHFHYVLSLGAVFGVFCVFFCFFEYVMPCEFFFFFFFCGVFLWFFLVPISYFDHCIFKVY
jgi:heme/copper-type cytochrome/quinol oxidase subunit 1